jgi:hypothetical protein
LWISVRGPRSCSWQGRASQPPLGPISNAACIRDHFSRVKLVIHLHLVPRLRMRGALPPLPHQVVVAQWLIKHRGNFTFHLRPSCITPTSHESLITASARLIVCHIRAWHRAVELHDFYLKLFPLWRIFIQIPFFGVQNLYCHLVAFCFWVCGQKTSRKVSPFPSSDGRFEACVAACFVPQVLHKNAFTDKTTKPIAALNCCIRVAAVASDAILYIGAAVMSAGSLLDRHVQYHQSVCRRPIRHFLVGIRLAKFFPKISLRSQCEVTFENEDIFLSWMRYVLTWTTLAQLVWAAA